VYERYVRNATVRKSERVFGNVMMRAWLNEQKAMSIAQLKEINGATDEASARVDSIVASLPSDVLDEKRGGPLNQRVLSILVGLKRALKYVDEINAEPGSREAIRRYLTIFDDLIEFPQFR
jgi:hypothetical protein